MKIADSKTEEINQSLGNQTYLSIANEFIDSFIIFLFIYFI